MTEEMRKGLEEAAEKAYPVYIGEYSNGKEYDTNECDRGTFIEGATIGAELGYKEAIAQAKEFAIKYIANWNMDIAKKYYSDKGKPSIVEATMSHGEFCRNLEDHLNKLWEGEK